MKSKRVMSEKQLWRSENIFVSPSPFATSKALFEILICLLLILGTLAVYWQVGNHEFVNFDDDVYVTANPHVQNGFTWPGIVWAFSNLDANYWHPLTWLTHLLDFDLYGFKAGGHHVTSLSLHLANVLLLFWVLRRMTGAMWRSAAVAALFAVHPLHVESVAWIAERKGVLSEFFFLLTICAYRRYAICKLENRKCKIQNYTLALLFFTFGLMSKPMVVTLPFVLLLLDYWPLHRRKLSTLRRLVLEKFPFFVLSIASGVWTFWSQKKGGVVSSLDILPLSARVENAIVSYFHYIQKMFCPTNLSVFYPYQKSLSVGLVIGGGILLVGVTVVAIWLGRRRPYLTMGWLWYLGTLVPVIGLVQVGGHAFADRYTYLPLIGLFVIIAWGAGDVMERWRWTRVVFFPAFAIGVVCCAFLTRMQAAYWHSSRSLFEHAIAVTTDNALAHVNLGDALLQERNPEAAARHSREALRINPVLSQAHGNLGLALRQLGQSEEGVRHLQEAVRLKPNSASAHNNLGLAMAVDGKRDEALAHYRDALRLKPDYPDAELNLGAVLNSLGRPDEAIVHFMSALKLNPNDSEAHFNLGVVLAGLGRYDEAMPHLTAVLKQNPQDADAHYYLATVYSAQKKTQEALAEYQTALRLDPNHAAARSQLQLHQTQRPD